MLFGCLFLVGPAQYVNDADNKSNTFHGDEPGIKSTYRFPSPFCRVLSTRLYNVNNKSAVCGISSIRQYHQAGCVSGN